LGELWHRSVRARHALSGAPMKKRFSIMVREYGSDHDIELMQVDSNPQAILDGLRHKTLTIRHSVFQAGKRQSKVPKYTFLQVVENE
jgi:hypothetical protein